MINIALVLHKIKELLKYCNLTLKLLKITLRVYAVIIKKTSLFMVMMV